MSVAYRCSSNRITFGDEQIFHRISEYKKLGNKTVKLQQGFRIQIIKKFITLGMDNFKDIINADKKAS